jgi:hypothetical protein
MSVVLVALLSKRGSAKQSASGNGPKLNECATVHETSPMASNAG